MKLRTLICAVCIVMAATIGCGETAAETRRALLVGISDYGNPKKDPDKWGNISGANDVALLKPLFAEQGYKVTSLVDAQATYANITKALKTMAKDAEKGDLVYLHFSMHGQPFEDLNGDEADGWDEALIPVDAQLKYVKGKYEGECHLLDDELEKYCNEIRSKIGPKGKLYVVLDACHSGQSSRGDSDHVRGVRDGFTRSGKDYTPDRTKDANDYFKVPTTAGQSPVTFVEACKSCERNSEVRDKESSRWYGSLSYYIARAMDKHKIDKSESWIDAVRTCMKSNRKLRHQTMITESSK